MLEGRNKRGNHGKYGRIKGNKNNREKCNK